MFVNCKKSREIARMFLKCCTSTNEKMYDHNSNGKQVGNTREGDDEDDDDDDDDDDEDILLVKTKKKN
jgi:hypothetical protein